ncbi:hypothetical protein [Algibacillus agarilyticus]|nr:hypothetical protein [Algibacillus agarilyticus]
MSHHDEEGESVTVVHLFIAIAVLGLPLLPAILTWFNLLAA